jgi:WD40 repeat protein
MRATIIPTVRSVGWAMLLGLGFCQAAFNAAPAAEAGTKHPELMVQNGHSDNVLGLAFNAEGTRLATASSDKTIKIWDVGTGQLLLTLQGSGWNYAVAFGPDGHWLASAGSNKTITLWDLATGQEKTTLRGHSDAIRSIALSRDGTRLASGSDDKTVKLWDVGTGQLQATLPAHTGIVFGVAFSPDGKSLASIDSSLHLWDVASATLKSSFQGKSGKLQAVAFSPDGKRLVTGSYDKVVELWDAATGRVEASLSGHEGSIESVAFSPDGKRVASSSTDKTAKLWDAATGQLQTTLLGHAGWVSSVAFSPDGTRLATGSWDQTVKLWDAGSNQLLTTLKGHSFMVMAVAFSPDGTRLVSGGEDKTVKLWNAATGQLLLSLQGHTKNVNDVAFSPDGKRLASADWDDTVKIWDATTGKEQMTLKGHRRGLAFSPDGKRLAIGTGEKSIKIWDVNTEPSRANLFATLQGTMQPQHIAFSPDGERLASGTWTNMVELWDVASGKLEATLKGHTNSVDSIAFSPDGKRLASASSDKTIKLWDAKSGELQTTLQGHSDWVKTLAFSPDGTQLASAGEDKVIRLWSLATGQEQSVLPGHDGAIWSIAFSPDGTRLASGSQDTTIKLWDVSERKLLATLVALDADEYVVTIPDGHYYAPKRALRLVSFRIDNKVFPFEQFDLKLNRPDLVLKTIGKSPPQLVEAYARAHEKRLKKMQLTEAMLSDDFHVPQAKIAGAPGPAKDGVVALRVSAADSKYLLNRFNVFVNDVPIYGIGGIDLRANQSSKYEKTLSLSLSNGMNKIQVSALNDKGVESLKDTLLVVHRGPDVKPNLFVVAIGVSEYKDETYQLKYAAKDAEDLARTLAARKGRFGNIEVLRITDAKATKENIQKAKIFLGKSKVDDKVIVFLAGHGLLDDKLDYYFATTDIDFQNPAARGLPYEDVEALLDGIPARQKLLLIDTCNSGEVEKEETTFAEGAPSAGVVVAQDFRGIKAVRKKQPSNLGLAGSYDLLQELFADLRRGSGAAVISSASGVEFAMESSEWKNGVFTYAVLEGIQTGQADLDKNGEITLSELRDYVSKRVQELTAGRQHPTSRRENLEFDFAL